MPFDQWWAPLNSPTEQLASHDSSKRDGADAQHELQHKRDARKDEAARQEDNILDSHMEELASHDSNRDRADAQHGCEAETEEAARQENNTQSELDALFNDFNREIDKATFNRDIDKATESHQQESDRLVAEDENTVLIYRLKELYELQARYSLLASLDVSKTWTIQARPIEELEAIVTRAIGLTQSTSHIEAARILDCTNSDLPMGTQLIADVCANVFIHIGPPGRVYIFDKADIQRIEYDTKFRVRLIMNGGWYMELCGAMNARCMGICDQWGRRYAEGVEMKYIRG